MKNIRIYILLLLTILSAGQLYAQKSQETSGKTVVINGLKIYYEESGKGMPLILLHPFGATSSLWKTFIPELSKYNRVIAVDLPGHGRSDSMDTTNIYLHKKAAEYIIGLIDFLKLDSVNMIGASSGGFVTLYVSTIRPKLTKHIVIIGGQIYYSQQTREVITAWGPGFENQERLNESIKTHGKEKGTNLERQFWNFRKLYGDPSFTPDVLASIQARTLIIHGDNDEIAPVTNAFEMYQNIKQPHLWIVPNGGHMPHLDPANQNEFLRRISEFLKNDWDGR
jgi:pimeloyl-ACP methyl ester carboxylesterase